MSVGEAARTLALPLQDPYVGLTHFTEEYAGFFFGRETESSLVIGNLRAARLTLLYAQSGVGKSSVLRAGVVARMHEVAARDAESRGSPRLVPVIFSSWSERPVAALIGTIGEAIRPYLAEAELPELPEEDLGAALEAASTALDATVLVILDQFEEYFLYPDEAPAEERIAPQLARCVNRPELRANFLISIREDAYAELGDLFRGKVKNVYGNFLHLDFLDRAGAREAIERPVERVNELQPEAEPHAVEPALVEGVLDQVGHDEADDRIETTYLQVVMRRLWEEETRTGSRVLRLATLEKLGGAQAIIGNHLDRAMEGDGGTGLGREQQLIAAAVFRFLVTSGGTKIALTAADLADLSGFSRQEVVPVLRHLSSPRLHILRPVVFEDEGSEPRYEIFHDALAEPIRKWRTRIEEEERDARRKRERAEKEEAQRAAAEAERQAEQERQRKRVAQALLALAVLVLLVGATVFALVNKNLADQRKADNQSVRVAGRISELAQVPSFGPTAAALAGVEDYRLSPTDEARRQALAQLQLSPGLPAIMAGHTDAVESVAYWPGAEMLDDEEEDDDPVLASGGDKTVRLWNAHGREVGLAPLVADADILEVAVSEPLGDGERVIAAGLKSKGVKLWRVTKSGNGKAEDELEAGPGIKGLAFDPADPGVLVAGSGRGQVTLWNLGDPRKPGAPETRYVDGKIEDLAFAPGGGSLFVASDQGGYEIEVSRGSFVSGPVKKPLEVDEPSAVAAGPRGAYAFGGKGGAELRSAGGSKFLRLPGKVYGLAFAKGGSVLVSGGSDWNVTTWKVKSGRPFGVPRAANRAAIEDVAVSPDGGSIAAGGADRLVKVWPVESSQTLATIVGGLSPAEADSSLPKIYDLVAGEDGDATQVAASLGPKGTAIWSLSGRPDPNTAHKPDLIAGRSFDAAYRGNFLVTGRGRSFVVYRRNSSCPRRTAGYCRFARPDEPRSGSNATSFVFAPYDGGLLASVGSKGDEKVLNLWKLPGRRGKVHALGQASVRTHLFEIAFDPVHPLIAAAAADGELRVWDIGDRQDPQPVTLLFPGKPERQPILTVAFSPDGSLLASGGQNQQVRLWRVSDEGEVRVEAIPGTLLQRQTITALAFSPDGETLAAADAGGNICFYEVENRRLIGDRSCPRGYNTSVLKRKNRGIEAMRFVSLPDDETVLLTAGRGQPVVAWSSLLWDLSDSDEVEEAIAKAVCRIAGYRALGDDEWSAAFTSTDFAGRHHETCA